MKYQPLVIGNITAALPIIQGGMGIGISLSSLAGAVAKEGGIGVISAAQTGYLEEDFAKDPLGANLRTLGREIRQAKEISGGGLIGVNIMCVTQDYDKYVQCCIENGADCIISGAGLPVNLPGAVGDSGIKIAPIVSPPKSAKVLLKMWDRRFGRTADFVVIEGPMAGGHLGYTLDELEQYAQQDYQYDQEVREILEIVKQYEEKYQKKIPVVFAGGVSSKEDLEHYLSLGCAGVQVATRFVATEECDADIRYKEAYLKAQKEDIMIVKSPVGMPGRAIRNHFMEERETKKEEIKKCYRCLAHCDCNTTPYCITGALMRAAQGDVENALLFCGAKAYQVNRIQTVRGVIQELCGE